MISFLGYFLGPKTVTTMVVRVGNSLGRSMEVSC